jgi:anaerobic selenocysteine-containing dehydrogenase
MPVTACPLDCPDTCSLEVTVEAGRITKVDAAPGNPFTQGWICQKVKKHAERVHGPRRLTNPLVRDGEKGEGRFRPVSWDDALDRVAAAVRAAVDAHGPASVVPLLYNSSTGALAAGALTPRLFRHLGASEVLHTICAATAGQAWRDTFGSMLCADPHDVVHARLVVVWGANPAVSNTHFPPLVQQARSAGARVVVIDPRRTAMAARADRHLAVRPGTDVVLALAVARHLSVTGLLARDFLHEHATGVDELLAASEPWTPERAADVTGVPVGDIVAFAEEYATTRPAFLRMGWGLERNRNGGSSCRAVLALPVLAGQVGVPGSGVMTSLSKAAPLSLRRGDLRPDAEPSRQLNMNHLGRLLLGELTGPPASVLFVQGANPLVTCPDQTRVVRGLCRDDLFTVVHEQVLTDTARFADVVLPATTHFEVDDVATSYGTYTLQRLRPVIPRVGESRTNDEVAAGLAARLGLDGFDPDPGSLLDAAVVDGEVPDGVRVLREPGTTVPFRDVWPTFSTHGDRRARLAPAGELPVPVYRPLDDPYPLTLLTPATHRTINSMFGEFNGPDPVVALHPDDVAARGITDGSTVRVHNDRGSLTTRVRVDASLRPGVCSMPKGLWLDALGGVSPNVLVPDTLSDLAGGACFNDARVEVSAAG